MTKTMTPEVFDGIRSRHSAVESAGQPIEAAQAMAYLSHLDRRDMLAEIERLTSQLRKSCDDERADPEGTACPIGYRMSQLERENEQLQNIIGHAVALLETGHAEQALKVLRLEKSPVEPEVQHTDHSKPCPTCGAYQLREGEAG